MLYNIDLQRDSELFQLLDAENISDEQLEKAKIMLKNEYDSVPEPVPVESIEEIQEDGDVARLGYHCLGKMTSLYEKNLPEKILENWYRAWIWENAEGKRVATWDQGNCYCSYMCEGTVEGILEYVAQQGLI